MGLRDGGGGGAVYVAMFGQKKKAIFEQYH